MSTIIGKIVKYQIKIFHTNLQHVSFYHFRLIQKSTDCITWYLVPKAEKSFKQIAPLAIGYFDGDPSTVQKINDDNFQLSLLHESESQVTKQFWFF